MQTASMTRSAVASVSVAGAVKLHHQSFRQVSLTSRLGSRVSSPRGLGVRCQAENEAPKTGAPTQAPTEGLPSTPVPEAAVPAKPATPSFFDLMSFSGIIPEVVNGRLAMLGFAAGVVAQAISGVSVVDQVFAGNLRGLSSFGFASVLIIAASVIPLLKDPSATKAKFSIFTPDAEKTNGRLAMLGLVGIVLAEYFAKSSIGV